MAIVDQLIAVLEYQTKGEADLKRFTKSLDTLATKAAAVGAAMGKVAAVAGAAVAGGLAFLGKSVIDTGRTFENLQIQLEALEGSQDKAKKAMDWIKTFAADTPLELEGVVKAYAQLRTYGLDPVNGSLLALVDTMAMSGKGQEHLDGIITAVGQAWTKQKLQGEEAMQLLERGVPVWDLLSTAMGKTVPELQELATKGKLGRKEIQLLINAMGKRAVGASAKMAKSLDGVTSALSDMWTEFKSRIADSGFYRSVKDQLERTLAVVKQWASDGTMDRAAGVIGGAFTRAANAVGSAIDRIVTHTGFLNKNWDKARPYIIAITAALAGLLAAWAPITAVVLAAAFAIDEFLTYLEDGDSVIGAFIDWIKNIASAFTENPAEAGAAWARLLIEGIKNAFSGLGAILNSVFGDSSGQVNWGAIGTNIATGIFNGIRNLLSMVIGFWSEVANSLLSVNWAGVGAQAMNLLWEGMKGVVESIKAWFMGAFSGMTVPGPTISAPTVTTPRQGGAPTPGGPAGTPDTNSFVPPETLKKRTDNLKGNLDRMNIGSSQVGGTRQVVYNVNAPITQHVAQATDAPGAAAKATQGAIKQAVRTQPSRLQAGAILA